MPAVRVSTSSAARRVRVHCVARLVPPQGEGVAPRASLIGGRLASRQRVRLDVSVDCGIRRRAAGSERDEIAVESVEPLLSALDGGVGGNAGLAGDPRRALQLVVRLSGGEVLGP